MKNEQKRFWIFMFWVVMVLAALPTSMSAQGPASKRVTLSFNKAPVSEVLSEIRHQTGLNYIMKSGADADRNVTVNVRNSTVTSALYEICRQIGCGYDISGGYITITPQAKDGGNQPPHGKRWLHGVVLDRDNEPLAGAVISIAGTGTGSVANANGEFHMLISTQSVKLHITYVGMTDKNLTIKAGGNDEVRNIKMESNTDIEEVVVTGYGNINRRQLTSSVTSIKAEDIMRPGINSIDQMLEGQVPDLIFTSNSGEVGSVPRLRIRGTSTLIGNREPLWVLDGVVLQDPVDVSPEELNNPDYINRIGNAISGINPQDIDRIDVLKDASATALYGAKAANGVIVITTKKGHVGKPIVNYNMNLSLKLRPSYTDRKIDLMNSRERVDFSEYLVKNGYYFGGNSSLVGYENLAQQFYSGQIDHETYALGVQQLQAVNTDWFDILTKNALSSSHSISVSGGSENARYYGSVGYAGENDVIRGNKNDRYSFALHLDANLNRIFSTSLGATGNVNRRKYNVDDVNVLDYAYNTSRAIPAFNADGSYYYYKQRGLYDSQYYNYNILNELNNSYKDQEGTSVNLNFTLNANISPWLKAHFIGSYQTSTTDQNTWHGENSYYASSLRRSDTGVAAPSGKDSQSMMPFGGELATNHYRNDYWMARLQVDFNKYLDANNFHNITASVGFEASHTRYKAQALATRGYYENRGKQYAETDLDSYPYYKSWLQTNAYPAITDNLTNLLSAYATVTYSYRNLLNVNANTRMDGSNKFGDRSNEKLLPIWSVSANYNLSEHKFFHRDWIDFLMLKASYGYQGNMLDGQSPQLIIKQLPTDALYNELVSQVAVYPNPNLKWEKTTSTNFGISTSLFDRRLQIEAEGYFKKTHDAFLTKDISSVNGISSYAVNSGQITNKGFNISITAVPVRLKDFSWTLSTSYSKVWNRLNTQPGEDDYDLSDFLNGTGLVKGKAVGTFYSYKFVGLSPVDGSPIFDDGEDQAEALASLSRYDFYRAILVETGSREPTVSGTFNNTLRYKNWRLNAVLNYSLGSKVRLKKLFTNTIFSPEENLNGELVNHWSKPGDELTTNIPNPLTEASHWSVRNNNLPTIASNNWDEYNQSDLRVVSGNYLKLATLSLTYEFDVKWLQKIGLSRLALNLTGTNLYTFCSGKLKGQTPQQSGFNEVQLTDCPQYTFGLDISF